MFTSRIFAWIYIEENALSNERHQTTIHVMTFFLYFDKLFFKERQRFVMQRSKNRLYQKNIESFFFSELTDITKLSEPPRAAITLCLRF